jgi:hypothetical protein
VPFPGFTASASLYTSTLSYLVIVTARTRHRPSDARDPCGGRCNSSCETCAWDERVRRYTCRDNCPGILEKCCPDGCRNIESDANNCGSCGVHCKPSEMCCNLACVDVLTDRYYCGGCGTGFSCGRCQDCVGGKCVNAFDGTPCGVPCQVCTAGICTSTCKVGQVCCGGVCCSSCVPSASPCYAGPDGRLICPEGVCKACPPYSAPCNGVCCLEGKWCCPDGCVDVKTDNKNCGKCGVVCKDGSTCKKNTAGDYFCTCPDGRTPCFEKCCSPTEECRALYGSGCTKR